MTPQEKTMLGDLIRRIQTTNLTEIDPEAQETLQRELGSNSDALYVLAQTVLVQNYALEQARRQIDQLKQQAQAVQTQPAKSGSFLGSIFGHHDEARPAAAPPASQWSTPQGAQGIPSQSYPAQNYPNQPYAPQNVPPQSYPSAAPSGGSSFLRSAATTAAGVAAGALAFEGVESLMHGFGHQAGFGQGSGFGGGMGMPMGEETIVNNYYDSPGGNGNEERDRYSNARDSSDPSDRDMPAIDNASYTGPQDDSELQPEEDQADDVNVTDDDGSSDDAFNDDGGGDQGDDSSFV